MASKIVSCDRISLLVIPSSYLNSCVSRFTENQCIQLEETPGYVLGKHLSIYIFASNIPTVFSCDLSSSAARLSNRFPFIRWKNEDCFMVKPSDFHPQGANTPELLPFAAIEIASLATGLDFCSAFKPKNWDLVSPFFNTFLSSFRRDVKESFKLSVYPMCQEYLASLPSQSIDRLDVKTVSGEKLVQLRLVKKLDGEVEVETPSGRIDILTKTHVIEVKEADSWKSAIGQVCAYARHYPGRKKRIHLFNWSKKFVRDNDIESFCKTFDIEVTYE